MPFQCIINISVFTPGEGFLKMMCYHLAQLMDRVLPKEKKKKKNHFVGTVPKKKHSNIAVWYVFRVLAIFEVPITSGFCLFVF